MTGSFADRKTVLIDDYENVCNCLRQDMSVRGVGMLQLERLYARTDEPYALLLRLIDNHPLLSNGAEHAPRRRQAIQIIARLARAWPAQRMQQAYADRFSQLATRESFDLHKDLSEHIMINMIAEVLGAPPGELKQAIAPAVAILDIAQRQALRMKDFIALARTVEGLKPLFDKIMIEPAEGLSVDDAALVAVLSLVPMVPLPSTALTFMLLHLSRHPELGEQLHRAPHLLTAFAHEALRLAEVVDGTTPVRAARELRLSDGKTIAPGQTFVCSIATANRDPSRFSDPDRLDVHRPERSEITFGTGPHRCPGAAFTLTQIEAALKAFLGAYSLCIPDKIISRRDVQGMRFRDVPARLIAQSRR